MGQTERNRVLLVGWDGASWDVIKPLLDREELPHLHQIIEQGVMGNLSTLGPLAAPIVYNSVATGKYADKHGVLGTEEVRRDRTVGPVNSFSRRAKAFWEILSQNDRRCHVVNFPATGPAEPTNGVFVTPAFFRHVPPTYRTGFDVPADSVAPDGRLPELKEFIVSLEDLDAGTVALFVPRLKEVDPKDERLALLIAILAQTLSVHAVVTWLIENTEWDVISVNYPAIGMLWRQFLKYLPPRPDWVAEGDFELYHEVAVSAVRLCDLLLGRLLELAGEEATVLLYSPRRYAPHHQLPREDVIARPSSSESWYRGQGIFVLRATTGRKDELIQKVSNLDLCPTVLRLCGVGPAEDLDGRALEDAFSQPLPPVETVQSWETIPPQRPQPEELAEPIPWTEMAGFAARYAHRPAWRVRTENDWRLARMFLASGRRGQALPLLTRLYYANPLQVDQAPMVTEAFYLTGQIPEALAVMEPMAEAFPGSPVGQFMAGVIALHRGYVYSALDFFEAAGKDNPPFPQLFYYLGQVRLALDLFPRAIEAYQRSLEIDPNFVHSHLGLSEAHYRSGQMEAAVDAGLNAIGVDFAKPAAHVALGKALAKLGQEDRARQAFQTALRLDPGHPAARARLTWLAEGGAGSDREPDLVPDGAPDLTAPSESAAAREQELDAFQATVKEAREEVDQWRSRFIEDLAAAERRLDDYLVENAAARQVEFSPEDAAKATDPGEEWRDVRWTIRPPLPADQPILCQMFDDPFADPYHQEVLLIHPAGSTNIRGGVGLCLQDPRGQIIKLALSVRGEADAALPGEAEEFLMTRLLRAAIARAAAAGAGILAFTFPGDESQAPLRRCLERLSFETTLNQTAYVMDMAEFRDRCLGLVERYRRRKAIPDDVRLVSLEEVPYAQTDQFLRQFFNDGAGASPHELCPPLSRVMLKGDKIIACYVGHKKGQETFVTTRLGVLDEFRHLWVTPWLLGDGSKGGCEDGLTRIEFYTDEVKYPELAKIARHMKAERTGTMCTMTLELAVPWEQEPPQEA